MTKLFESPGLNKKIKIIVEKPSLEPLTLKETERLNKQFEK